MRYAILVSYDGSRYQGWQKQGNTANTITEKIETVISRQVGEKIHLTGAGRTDAGVHAAGQVACFDCSTEIEPAVLEGVLADYLPEDIAVQKISNVPMSFHPRFSSVGKIYRYEIREEKTPDVFRRKYQWHLGEELKMESMLIAASMLIGEHDFRGFSSDRHPAHSTVRRIEKIDISRSNGALTMIIEGNGFLYNMVRIIAGTLAAIGTGNMQIEQVEAVLATGDRQLAGITAPAKGLTLLRVLYPAEADPFEK